MVFLWGPVWRIFLYSPGIGTLQITMRWEWLEMVYLGPLQFIN